MIEKPLNAKNLETHIESASRYNRPLEPTGWWWFGNLLTALTVVGAGLVIFVAGR